jgi:hypothetical protein
MLLGASMLLLAQPGNAGLMTAMSPANNAWLFVHRKNAWRAARESIESASRQSAAKADHWSSQF